MLPSTLGHDSFAPADEAGAFCVIELVCAEGERLCIYPIPGDRIWMMVASLPARAR